MTHLKNSDSLYPDCWSDDVRMNVLFSPFRPKFVNPENYISKLNFWKIMIKKYCEQKGCAQFNKLELLINFQRNDRSPYCLDHVLDDMLQNREIKDISKFNEDIEDGWSIWALKTFVKKPIVWGLQKTIGSAGTVNQNVEYIDLRVLEQQSSNLLRALKQLSKRIVRYDEISSLPEINLNDSGIILCLRFLHFSKKLHIEYQMDKAEGKISVIKVPKDVQAASPLTDLEWTLFNLENTLARLDKNIDELHTEMKNSEDSARSYIREGKKSLAKANLRKKHLIEKNLEKRIIARDNIHVLIINLKEVEENSAVLDAMKMGSNTLKSIFKKSDMDLDKVDEIIFGVKDTLDLNEDIQKSIAEPFIDNTIDDSMLEEELNEILSTSNEDIKETNKEKEKEKEMEKLKDEEKEILERLENLKFETSSPPKEGATTPVPFP